MSNAITQFPDDALRFNAVEEEARMVGLILSQSLCWMSPSRLIAVEVMPSRLAATNRMTLSRPTAVEMMPGYFKACTGCLLPALLRLKLMLRLLQLTSASEVQPRGEC